MSPDVLDRAIEPFFTTKEAGRGTGMGLCTVYGFVKQSRGHLGLDSAPGAGTTVTLYLPAHDAPGESDKAPPAAATRLSQGLRVLLVEDAADVRSVAQSFLPSLGCAVVACANTEAALAELAAGATFDLLFSDITLGAGIDGHKLARRVNAQHPALAVLLTSGYSRYLAGSGDAALDWPELQKPYQRQNLAQAIAHCLPAPAPPRSAAENPQRTVIDTRVK